jgi:hypothetical protein
MGKLIATAVGNIVISIVVIIFFGLLLAFPTEWLWNGILVGLISGISPISSVWNAWGLLILCGLLFKSGSRK